MRPTARRELGDRIAGHRRRAGQTQAQLAADLGVTSQQVSRWERGVQIPSTANVTAIAARYGLSFESFLPAVLDATNEALVESRREAGHDRRRNEELEGALEDLHRRLEAMAVQFESAAAVLVPFVEAVLEGRVVIDRDAAAGVDRDGQDGSRRTSRRRPVP